MKELVELEEGVGRLKREIQEQKILIDTLEKEKSALKTALNKLQSSYDTLNNKILDFVNQNINNLKLEVNELRAETKRIPSIEKNLSEKIDELNKAVSFFKDELKGIKLKTLEDVEKKLSALNSEIESRIKEMDKHRIEEMKAEMERIARIEEELEIFRDTQEDRTDKISEEISSLKNLPGRIDSLAEQLKDTRSVIKKLEEAYINKKEFVETVKSLTEVLENLKRNYEELDKRIAVEKSQLESIVHNILSDEKFLESSQEKLRELIDEKTKKLTDETLSMFNQLLKMVKKNSETVTSLKARLSDVKEFTGQVKKNTKSISDLESRFLVINDITSDLKDIRKRFGEVEQKLLELHKLPEMVNIHDKHIGKLVGFSDGVRKDLETFSNHIKSLEDRLEELKETVASVDGFTKSETSSMRSSLEDLQKNFSSLYQEVQDHMISVEKLIKSFENSVNNGLNELKENTHSIINEYKKEIDAKLSDQGKMFSNDVKSIIQRVSVLENISRDFESRMDGLTKETERLRNFVSEINGLKKHMAEMDESIKLILRRISDKDAIVSHIKALDDSVRELKEKHTVLENKFVSSTVRFDSAIKQIISNINEFEKRQTKERERLSRLLKELRE
ncbi:MAG: hypothetical protein DRP15_00125 [Candidatus Aenigmatarchaeota archaeon]|nr:MAG: hypothetical protein DRP15_00125 [Candidatus Aenigmarchaeota archaeon]